MATVAKDIMPEDILTWADYMAGTPAATTAKQQKCHPNTILNRRKKVAEFISQKFDINEYRMPLYQLYPLVVKSLIRNLSKFDVTTTIAVAKGLQLLVDKGEMDIGLGGVSDADLIRIVQEGLGAQPSPETENT